MRKNFAPVDSNDLERYARAIGRVKENRGKEPTWVRKHDPHLSPPLSIPNHSKDLKPATARNIIDQLIGDLDEWEMHLAELDEEND